ncbi:hypothetical protein [Phaeobacter sp. HF9A]|uniref:hypothetical protein n=1 Tax=Phaeobacter sp. HF9A TaxID=2721561 RepID=UPI001430869B|nr:hypothetical protein [Phaeobacter sp. HF9A]NIZ11899.1 hypothetical protein [Phaeobacter sp. HF9A]
MSPFDNPFPASDAQRRSLWEAHMRIDIDAFIAGDWDAVAPYFDAERFIALDAGGAQTPADWTIGFPDLAAYRTSWLEQSQQTLAKADPEQLRQALFSGAEIARIDFYGGDTAILHKVFDGKLPLRDGSHEPYSWQSVFTLRKSGGDWKIVSFVGYLPR